MDDAEATRADDAEATRAPRPRAQPTPRPYAAALDDVARDRDALFEELGERRRRHDAQSVHLHTTQRAAALELEAERAAAAEAEASAVARRRALLCRERNRREARGDALNLKIWE